MMMKEVKLLVVLMKTTRMIYSGRDGKKAKKKIVDPTSRFKDNIFKVGYQISSFQ